MTGRELDIICFGISERGFYRDVYIYRNLYILWLLCAMYTTCVATSTSAS